jgi:serine phosphatase RsbU (regulator of sigma subunit)
VVFYTDGVTEARQGRDFYGDDRLLDLIAGAAGGSPAQVTAAIEADAVAFQSGFPRDDIAVVALGAPPEPDS